MYSIVLQQLNILGEFITHRIKYGMGHCTSYIHNVHLPPAPLGLAHHKNPNPQVLTCSVASNAEKSLEKTSLLAGKIYSVWWVILLKDFEMFRHTCIWNRKNRVYAAQNHQSQPKSTKQLRMITKVQLFMIKIHQLQIMLFLRYSFNPLLNIFICSA